MSNESTPHEEHSLLLAGLPATGKTSYLALLYLAIARKRTHSIVLGSFTDDREYLNEVAGRLMSCEEALHTEVGERRELALSLSLGDERNAFLRIPDLSGETWEQVLHERRWDEAMESLVAAVEGVLLFLHVTEFDSGASIAAADAAEAALGGSSIPATGDSAPKDAEYRPPAQVEVVDLLQVLVEQRSLRPARVSLILSAWDLAPSGLTPEDWLRDNAPLAHQYLVSNRDWLEARIWGVSAQGGSYRSNSDRAQLAGRDAVDRAFVIDRQGDSGTVDDPVLWALGELLDE